jgi:hypothetical protein
LARALALVRTDVIGMVTTLAATSALTKSLAPTDGTIREKECVALRLRRSIVTADTVLPGNLKFGAWKARDQISNKCGQGATHVDVTSPRRCTPNTEESARGADTTVARVLSPFERRSSTVKLVRGRR